MQTRGAPPLVLPALLVLRHGSAAAGWGLRVKIIILLLFPPVCSTLRVCPSRRRPDCRGDVPAPPEPLGSVPRQRGRAGSRHRWHPRTGAWKPLGSQRVCWCQGQCVRGRNTCREPAKGMSPAGASDAGVPRTVEMGCVAVQNHFPFRGWGHAGLLSKHIKGESGVPLPWASWGRDARHSGAVAAVQGTAAFMGGLGGA